MKGGNTRTQKSTEQLITNVRKYVLIYSICSMHFILGQKLRCTIKNRNFYQYLVISVCAKGQNQNDTATMQVRNRNTDFRLNLKC